MYPGIENVPELTRDGINVESMLEINPDVVLVDGAETIEMLRKNNIAAVGASIMSPESLMGAVKLVGDILQGDAAKKADEYCKYYQDIIDRTSKISETIKDEDKPRVYYCRSALSTTGEGTMPDFWINLAGGINVARDFDLKGPNGAPGSPMGEITIEELLNADPDIIITERPQVAQEIREGKEYSKLKAVKNNKVIANPIGASIWSMGSAEAALQAVWAPTLIQPELFKDTDVKAEIKKFYNTFYEYDISDEQIDTILNTK